MGKVVKRTLCQLSYQSIALYQGVHTLSRARSDDLTRDLTMEGERSVTQTSKDGVVLIAVLFAPPSARSQNLSPLLLSTPFSLASSVAKTSKDRTTILMTRTLLFPFARAVIRQFSAKTTKTKTNPLPPAAKSRVSASAETASKTPPPTKEGQGKPPPSSSGPSSTAKTP